MNPTKRRAIYERLRSLNPHPRTELEYETPFQLLVAVVLSAQATDKSVNLANAAVGDQVTVVVTEAAALTVTKQ